MHLPAFMLVARAISESLHEEQARLLKETVELQRESLTFAKAALADADRTIQALKKSVEIQDDTIKILKDRLATAGADN